MKMAIPMIIAQIVSVLYNIVDRLYIARIPEDSFNALTGIGVCLPVISMVMAFANLFGIGGAPLCAIERGKGNLKLRKVVVVIPLTILLPRFTPLGYKGVFLSEPISEFIGGTASFTTMMLTVWKELKEKSSKAS